MVVKCHPLKYFFAKMGFPCVLRVVIKNLFLLPTSAANKSQSTVNYCQSSDFDRPYLSCNDHCDRQFFQEIFFIKYRFYFLEILLNDLELVFLEFKHIYKTKTISLFYFYLFVTRCFVIILCITPFHTFPLRVNTHNVSVRFLFNVLQS